MKKPTPKERHPKPTVGKEHEISSGNNFIEDVLVYDFLVPLSPDRVGDLFPTSLHSVIPGKKDETRVTVVQTRKKKQVM